MSNFSWVQNRICWIAKLCWYSRPLFCFFVVLWPWLPSSTPLTLINIVITNHLSLIAYITSYLLQLGFFFLSRCSWLWKRERALQREQNTKKLNTETLSPQFVGKSDYSSWYLPQNICDSHKSDVQLDCSVNGSLNYRDVSSNPILLRVSMHQVH